MTSPSTLEPLSLMERALHDGRVDIEFRSKQDMWKFRSRLHAARFKDRERAKRQLPPEDPMWNKSPYDVLIITSDIKQLVLTLIRAESIEAAMKAWGILDIRGGNEDITE